MQTKSQRLLEFDFLRVLAMAMMIIGHAFFDLVKPNLYSIDNSPWVEWNFLRSLTAPIFLFVSGFVQIFANKREASGVLKKDIAIKRVKTIALLYFLGYYLQLPAQNVYHIPFVEQIYLERFYQVNILPLISSFYVILLLLFIFTRQNRVLGWICFSLAMINFLTLPIARQIDWFGFLPAPIAPYFSYQKGSYFTIFPYLGYFLFGSAFGCLIISKPDSERRRKIILYSFVFSLITIIIGLIAGFGFEKADLTFKIWKNFSIGYSFIRLSFVLLLICIVTFVFKLITPRQTFSKIVTILGKNSLIVYACHLVILYGLPWYASFARVYFRKFEILESFLLSFLVLVASFGIVFLVETLGNKNEKYKTILKYGVLSALIMLVLV